MELSSNEDSDAKRKNQHFSIDYSLTSLKLLSETLIQEIKSVVTESYESEYRDTSKLIAVKFGQSEFWLTEQNQPH